jgi:hypothetical protein
MKITHHFVSTDPQYELANGIVTIVRPLSPHEADMRHGPMYLCRAVYGEFIAYHHELDFDGYRAEENVARPLDEKQVKAMFAAIDESRRSGFAD